MSPTRRTVLGIAATAIGAGAGCLGQDDSTQGGNDPGTDGDTDDSGTDDDGTDDEDAVPVLTGHAVSEHAADPTTERESDLDPWALFLASREASDDHFGDVDEAVQRFVDETDFEAGDRLLYVQAYGPQTCYALVLERDPHVADNGVPRVDTRVERTAPEDELCGDAITPVRSLVRLSFDPDAGSTDVVDVHVTDQQDETTELLVEATR